MANEEVVLQEQKIAMEYDICNAHGHRLEYWCCKCQLASCRTCLPTVHRDHLTFFFEDLFTDELCPSKLESAHQRNSQDNLLQNIDQNVEFCDEGLHLVEQMKNIGAMLSSWKTHLLEQKQVINRISASAREMGENEEAVEQKSSIIKKDHWLLMKMMSRADECLKSSQREWQHVVAKLSALEPTIEKADAALRTSRVPFLPEEYLPNVSEWTLEGEYSVKKALATLEKTSNRPKGPITVKFTKAKPAVNVSQLMLKLNRSIYLKLLLLDSFLCKNRPPFDCLRLGLSSKNNYNLDMITEFVGHLEVDKLKQLSSLQSVGIRLDATKDVGLLNTGRIAQCDRRVAVARTIKPEEIQQQITKNEKWCDLHFSELQDDEVPWMTEVAEKLLPSGERQRFVLPLSRLTPVGVEKLLLSIAALGRKEPVWVQTEVFSASEKERLVELAEKKQLELFWGMPYWN